MRNKIVAFGVSRLVTASAMALVVIGGAYLLVPAIQVQALQTAGAKTNPAVLAATQKTVTQPPEPQLGEPVSLALPRLGLQKAIAAGSYNAGTSRWTLNKSQAFFMSEARTPLIYGHNVPSVFGPLKAVAADEILKINNAAGQVLIYKYSHDKHVAPTETAVIVEDQPRTVLLMTCSGFKYQKRRVLYFSLVGLEQPKVATQVSHGS